MWVAAVYKYAISSSFTGRTQENLTAAMIVNFAGIIYYTIKKYCAIGINAVVSVLNTEYLI